MSDPSVLTTGDIARRYQIPEWRVRRLFERRLLRPTPRVGSYRIVAAHDLPKVEEALIAAGYLPAEEVAPCH